MMEMAPSSGLCYTNIVPYVLSIITANNDMIDGMNQDQLLEATCEAIGDGCGAGD
jgi:hypothetical protein